MRKFIETLLRHRGLAAALIFVTFAAAAYSARTIRLRFQYSDFYDYPGNTALPAFKRDLELFGDPAGYMVVMIEADDVTRSEVATYVQRLTRATEQNPAFVRVRSLANSNAIRSVDGEVVTDPLLRDVPASEQVRADVKRIAIQNPLFARRLMSSDGKCTAVLAEMRVPPAFATIDDQAGALAVMRDILKANPAPAGVDVRVTGAPAIEVGTTDAILDDQKLLIPAACALLALMLYLTFRSAYAVLICLTPVTVSTVWTAGIYALFGHSVDLIGSTIPTVLLVYSVVDPIFVLSRFLGKVELGLSRERAIAEALSELALPCFLTSLPTGIGFAAFLVSDSPSLRRLGLTSGCGVMLAFVTTVTMLPLLISALPLQRVRPSGAGFARRLDRLIEWVGVRLRGRSLQVIAAACVLIATAAWFVRGLPISNAYVEALPEGQIRSDVRHLEKKLSGVIGMNLLLHGEPGSLKRPDVLRAIRQVDKTMEQNPGVTFSGSVADLIMLAHAAFVDAPPGDEASIPSTTSLIAQYFAMIDPRDRSEFVTPDFANSHMALLLYDRGTAATWQVFHALEAAVRDVDFAKLGLDASITGRGLVASRELDRTVVELLYGFVFAFAVVLVFEWLMFRSLRVAFITILPNLLPALVTFVTMRLLQIPLRIDTVLVGCVSIGGLFNTTIHFVARCYQQIAAGKRDPDAIVLESMRAVGPPSLYTSAILSFGFAAFVLSKFLGLQMFGVLSMVTFATAFVSDMVVTPALFRLAFDWKSAFQTEPSQPVTATVSVLE